MSESVRTPPRGTSQYRNGSRIQSIVVAGVCALALSPNQPHNAAYRSNVGRAPGERIEM